LVRTIIRGHDKTRMPAWAWEMEEYEARWLVRFIRSGRVSGKTNAAGQQLTPESAATGNPVKADE
jgi:hypothetical protein